jgi:predicted deacylase
VANTPFEIAGTRVTGGTRDTIDLPLPRLNSRTELFMPVHIVQGKQQGPRLFVSAAIHGDEINGVEIIRELLSLKTLRNLTGTLVAVPVVNVYGLIHESRYLPDRRDLNRSFPGSESGSLAARVAHQFMTEIVGRCTHGIDLHTGAFHRDNLPQIRANLDDPETERLARAFGVPVLINSALRDGSLREAAAACGIPMLLYEAGEALRYSTLSIRAGVHGILQVMRELGMLPESKRKRKTVEPFIARASSWIRAPESGMVRTTTRLGALISRGDTLGHINDIYSGMQTRISSPYHGVIIGQNLKPIVHEGDALFHVARFRDDLTEVAEGLDNFHQAHSDARD